MPIPNRFSTTRRMPRPRWRIRVTTAAGALSTAALLLWAGCGQEPITPSADQGDPAGGPAFTISDGAHGGGTHFYFLPPLAPTPIFSGTFDPSFSPTVVICAAIVPDAGVPCGSDRVATFTGSDVKLDLKDEAYVVAWKTKGAALDPAIGYQIEVYVGALRLGYADVVVVDQGQDLRAVDNDETFAVLNGGVATIRFRIEKGAAAGWKDGDVVTYSQAEWVVDATPRSLLLANYDNLYASSYGIFEVGIAGSSGYSIQFTGASRLIDYLPPAGSGGPLTEDLVDPTSSQTSLFAGEVVALKLNVDFSDQGILSGGTGLRFGDLTLCGLPPTGLTGGTTAGLNGISVRQVLGIVNIALGGGSTDYDIEDLDSLAGAVNSAFNAGTPNAWAQAHLFNGACPP